MDLLGNPGARERAFRAYMDAVFRTGKVPRGVSPAARRSLKNGYLRFLRGWMLDASSEEGAVLKGWVESRFGLPPVFHAGRIENADTEEYLVYLSERMRESTRTNAVDMQFDLLYEYVQYELARRHPRREVLPPVPRDPQHRGLPVPRGKHDTRAVVRMNSLNSFSSRLEYAWEFGGHVFEADVPASKIFFPVRHPSRRPAEGGGGIAGDRGDFDVIVRSY
jgi:NAD+--dinitrogen-reductase ADP-D-ribosyltransferase